jgi:hypothetical protein
MASKDNPLYVTELLLNRLDEWFPIRMWHPTMRDGEMAYNAGQRSVIDRLRKEYDKAN